MFRIMVVGLLAVLAARASADVVTIDVTLDPYVYLNQDDDLVEGNYELTGQSAYLQYHTSSSTSGGQLDGVVSGGTSISYTEVFPPPSLSDYLEFAYFGLVETYDENSDLLDTSFVVALAPGIGVGLTVADLFTYTEAQLVVAMGTSFDSPEFFDIMGEVSNLASARGVIGVPPVAQVGEVLDLIAFVGGVNGTVGVKIGTLATTVVPEPASLGLLSIASLALLRRRRSI